MSKLMDFIASRLVVGTSRQLDQGQVGDLLDESNQRSSDSVGSILVDSLSRLSLNLAEASL